MADERRMPIMQKQSWPSISRWHPPGLAGDGTAHLVGVVEHEAADEEGKHVEARTAPAHPDGAAEGGGGSREAVQVAAEAVPVGLDGGGEVGEVADELAEDDVHERQRHAGADGGEDAGGIGDKVPSAGIAEDAEIVAQRGGALATLRLDCRRRPVASANVVVVVAWRHLLVAHAARRRLRPRGLFVARGAHVGVRAVSP